MLRSHSTTGNSGKQECSDWHSTDYSSFCVSVCCNTLSGESESRISWNSSSFTLKVLHQLQYFYYEALPEMFSSGSALDQLCLQSCSQKLAGGASQGRGLERLWPPPDRGKQWSSRKNPGHPATSNDKVCLSFCNELPHLLEWKSCLLESSVIKVFVFVCFRTLWQRCEAVKFVYVWIVLQVWLICHLQMMPFFKYWKHDNSSFLVCLCCVVFRLLNPFFPLSCPTSFLAHFFSPTTTNQRTAFWEFAVFTT